MFPYVTALWLVKGCILSFYYKVLVAHGRARNGYRHGLHFVSAITLATYLLALIFNAIWCLPVASNWSLEPAQTCITAVRTPSQTVLLAANLSTNLLCKLHAPTRPGQLLEEYEVPFQNPLTA